MKPSITAEVASQLPVAELEIIVNGEAVAGTAVRDGHRSRVTAEYTPAGSVWIAARAYADPLPEETAGTNFYVRTFQTRGTELTGLFGTLNPEVPFAHTSPVYVRRQGHPIRSATDARFYVEYLNRIIEWLGENGRFQAPGDRGKALALFRQAREEFERRSLAE